MKPDTDSVLHRYIDGELGPADRLRVEERLRSDPAFRAEYEIFRDLDRTLTEAIGGAPDRIARLQDAVAAQVRRTPTTTVAPVRSLWSRERWSIAAGFAMLAIGIYAAASVLKEEPPSNDALIDSYRAKIAQLERENSRLRRADDRGGTLPAVAAAAKKPAASVEKPTEDDAPPPPVGPTETVPLSSGNADVLASIRGMLNEFGSSQHWDRNRALALLRLLKNKELSKADFLEMESMYRQQSPGTMGQLFIAQAMENFVHLPEARRFLYDQAERALMDLRGSGGTGDRMLRRAWTDSLTALGRTGDSKSIDYLEEMGRLDRDWGNRRNVMGALANVGNAESIIALIRVAGDETNPVIRQDGMYYIRDALGSDPTLLAALGNGGNQLLDPLTNVVRGEFGDSGEHWEAMVLALEILSQLSFDGFNELYEEWRQRNLTDPGGDPIRGGNPRGLPLNSLK